MKARKIFKQKLENYLRDEIELFRQGGAERVFMSTMSLIEKNTSSPEDILKHYYFFQYYNNASTSLQKQNNRNTLTSKSSETEVYLRELDIEIANKSFEQQPNNLMNFLLRYGNSRQRILKDIKEKIERTDMNLADLSRWVWIFGVNSFNFENNSTNAELHKERSNLYPSFYGKWEESIYEKLVKLLLKQEDMIFKNDHCIKRIFPLLQSTVITGREDRIKEYEQLKRKIDKILIPKSSYKNLFPTQTQGKVKKQLDALGLVYNEEYNIDYYNVDFYLPDLNIALEYNGPDHYYPLQTQLNESSKFRYFYLKRKGIKVCLINYWEWKKMDIEQVAYNYVEKLLRGIYRIEEGPLFFENFDTLKMVKTRERL